MVLLATLLLYPFVYWSICLSVLPSMYVCFVCIQCMYLGISLCMYIMYGVFITHLLFSITHCMCTMYGVYTSLSICLSFHLSICFFVHPPIHPSVHACVLCVYNLYAYCACIQVLYYVVCCVYLMYVCYVQQLYCYIYVYYIYPFVCPSVCPCMCALCLYFVCILFLYLGIILFCMPMHLYFVCMLCICMYPGFGLETCVCFKLVC